VPVRSDAPAVIGPPLRGGPWVGLYDPALVGGHRTALYTIDGRARIPGRFAIDWVRIDASGNRFRGDPEQVASHLGFGADVLAVADARVADARDDMPDADLLAASRGPMALERASGNYVVLDVGGGRYAFYEHLKHGSLRVKKGDRVARGDVIAALGNTGSSSSGPHLHFHVADGEATLGAEGVPWVLDGFEQLGGYEDMDAAVVGKVWQGQSGVRLRELPVANAVVVFPDAERGAAD
jgi:murein DD-endopeptidase